ncbi:MAG: Ig-like domain-containing protein [Gemmatimonadota bacterium]|nr:Ig-like domain-containing protein [Gemmatimonadota bacterium]
MTQAREEMQVRGPSRAAAWAALAAAGLVVGCARPELPRGGPEDRTPPYVLEAQPDTFARVAPGLREIRFRFSERISERPSTGTLNDAVLVSPSVGNVQVSHGRDALQVRIQEGLRAGQVYRITVLPVIADMFGNRLRDPFDLVISTGGTPIPNVVAGVAEDRITGRPVDGARVEAVFFTETDTVVHWNYADAEGIYSLRYLPDGPYTLRVYEDRNRNATLDPAEPRAGPLPGQIELPIDTAFAVVSLIMPDTTPPRLTSVEALDSMAIILAFDDHLDPFLDLDGVPVTVADSAGGPEIGVELMNEVDFNTRTGQGGAGVQGDEAPPSQQADPPPDSGQAAAGAGQRPPGQVPGAPGRQAAPGRGTEPRVGLSGLPLPAQTVHALLETPLVPGAVYRVRISGLTNVAGTGGGGGEGRVVWEPPEADTTPRPDSVGVDTIPGDPLPDSLAVDTLAVGPGALRLDLSPSRPESFRLPLPRG